MQVEPEPAIRDRLQSRLWPAVHATVPEHRMRDQSPVLCRDAGARKPGGPTDELQRLSDGALIGDWIVWLFFGGIFGWSWHHPRTRRLGESGKIR